MSKKPETKKEKQRKKNLRDWRIFMQSQEQREKVDIDAPEIKPAPPPPPKTKEQKEQEIWSAKLQEIKDINTGRRRAATDRWNRFAGTSGAGGRGR